MKMLNQISITFLRKSKQLTAACFISVFTAAFLLILMFHLTVHSQKTYERSVRDTLGDCDMIVMLPEGSIFKEGLLQKIKKLSGIQSMESGYQCYSKIQDLSVYMAGVVDGSCNRARYQYTAAVSDDKIIFNKVLADTLNVETGDQIAFGSRKLELAEIISDDAFTMQNSFFAVVSQRVLCEAAEVENMPNYLFIKCKKSKRMNELEADLRACSRKLEITLVEDIAQYKTQMKAFKVFMMALAVIAAAICGLLIAGVFRSFLQKYSREMMVLRTLGGTNEQVIIIFMLLGMWVVGAGCAAALAVAIPFGKLIFSVFAKYLSLSVDTTEVYSGVSAGIVLGVFLIINLLLFFSVKRFVRRLPLQSVREKRWDRTYTGNGVLSRWVSRILKGDRLVSYKMAVPKIKQNAILLLTILLITTFSYVGNDFMQHVEANNSDYYRKMYLDEVMIENGGYLEDMSGHDVWQIYQELEGSVDCSVFPVIDFAECGGIEVLSGSGNKNSWVTGCAISDLKKLYQRNVIPIDVGDKENAIVLSRRAAEALGWQEGKEYSGVFCNADGTESRQRFFVAGLLPTHLHGDLILDINNPLVRQWKAEPEGLAVTMFASGETEILSGALRSLRMRFPELHWQSYSYIVEWSNRVFAQRFGMTAVVLHVLALIAGAGWFHSARNMILSRVSDYQILRKLGMSGKRTRKLIWRQIFLYLVMGIGMGILFGVLLASWLSYWGSDYEVWKVEFKAGHIWFILVVYALLGIGLQPLVRRVAKMR